MKNIWYLECQLCNNSKIRDQILSQIQVIIKPKLQLSLWGELICVNVVDRSSRVCRGNTHNSSFLQNRETGAGSGPICSKKC